MSWSVNAVGRPAAVKAALATQFENAKKNTASVPHEQASVGLIAQLVSNELDFLTDVPGMAVRVEASGHAYKSGSPPTSASTSVKVDLQPLYGWVE